MDTTPSVTGFLAFVRAQMGISTTILPDSSTDITDAYNYAIEIVSDSFINLGGTIYTRAVYNFAGDNLINNAVDQPSATPTSGSIPPPLPYFEDLRRKWQINSFVSGVINSSSDESTSQSMVVQKAAEDFQLGDLQLLKTPYGRAYLAIAQKYGPVLGIS